ncbi:MAG: signal recognition particle protein [Caldisericum sp.]|uniref:signal-recognition-particle GTPase n=1 Tax=Caldisericum exile TaxID=693075 RepID=A0A2J6WEA7_9BACT|nr:MAG: signal recognition particle protein [Caldisericum exile]PMP84173.1 MAG: signal recognition particle protein [Caldisericum exile]
MRRHTIFESLKESINTVLKKLRSKGHLSEADIKAAIKEIRLALLEADVNYKLVKEITEKVETEAKSSKVLESFTPAEQILSILYSVLVDYVGHSEKLKLHGGKNFIILVGLQGNGKTTTAAKLGYYLKKKLNYNPILVPFDFKRPASFDQLIQLGKSNDIAYLDLRNEENMRIALSKIDSYMEKNGFNVAIIDTAGRKEIDTPLMEELKLINNYFEDPETLMVMDVTLGQTSLDIVKGFKEYLKITGGIFTKFDSSAKGGSVLSFKYVTGSPVKFVGTGEKIQDLEPFDGDALISRLVGRGDLKGLFEKAQEAISLEESEKIAKDFQSGNFDLNDLKMQLESLLKMGGLSKVFSMLPNFSNLKIPKEYMDEKALRRMIAIINAMTKEERAHPEIINASRKERIAKGTHVSKAEVNQLLKNFENFKKLSKNLKNLDISKFRF